MEMVTIFVTPMILIAGTFAIVWRKRLSWVADVGMQLPALPHVLA